MNSIFKNQVIVDWANIYESKSEEKDEVKMLVKSLYDYNEESILFI
ncbi:hypothetical protein [Pontimicrobium sp. IMCC45349]|jgi:hypothetical protein